MATGGRAGSHASHGKTTRFGYFPAFVVRADLELPFLVGAALALDVLLAVLPVTAFLAPPRLVLDLVFFSGATFFPAYVFFGAGSVFFAVDALTAGFAGLEGAAGFLTVLAEDALVVEVFEDGALRVVEDLVVVVDFPVEVFDFDPGFVAGFEAALVGGFEVFEVGLFSFASSEVLRVFGAIFTRPDGPLGRWKTPFSAPTAIALLSCVTCAFPISSWYASSTYFLI